jgi:VWFA-related protein
MFRSNVSVVGLDVSVFDKNREPVRGLTSTDFTVLEDGKPQKVVAFSAVDVPDAPAAPPTASWQRTVSPDVQTNVVAQAPEGRLFVLLLDDALMPFDPASVQNAKKIARSVIDRLSPDDQMAVVFSEGSAGTQDFTSDRPKLLKAVETLHTGAASYAMGWDTALGDPRNGWQIVIDGDANFRLASLRTLRDVADTLIAAPKRRKTLIFVTPGVPVDLDAVMPSQLSNINAGKSGIPRVVRDMNAQLSNELPTLYQAMRRANVTIYPIDPCGFGGLSEVVKRATQGTYALSSSKTEPPNMMQDWYGFWASPPRPQDVAHRVERLDLDFMNAAAANTGGHAIVNTNDFEPGIAQIFRENASYYVLGYEAPGKNAPGSLHRLTVKVNRPGLEVRTRSGYDMPEAEKIDPKHPAPSATSKAVAGPVAAGDLPMEVALAPVAVHGRAEAAVAIALGIRQPAVTTRTVQTFQLQARIFTPDGRAHGEQHQAGQVTLAPAEAGAAKGDSTKDFARYELLTQIALKPGRYEIRFATHLDAGDITSSVYADVEVPDFAKAPLSLSGLMLEASPPLPGGPRNAFDGLLPVAPTSKRDFATTDQVAAFLQINEGGDTPLAPVALAIRIVNDHDITVFERAGTVGANLFPASLRGANQRFALPLSTLAPGAYLLTVEATLGKATARRDVRFVVTRSVARPVRLKPDRTGGRTPRSRSASC